MLSGHCDSAYTDFTYNINKYNITHNGLLLQLILLINDFAYNSK
jgi:hypothetical protein